MRNIFSEDVTCMCNGRVITLINYVEMFSLLGVLNMEGRVWFEDKPYEDKPLRYC